MRRVFVVSSMFVILLMISGQVVHAEEEGKRNRGLVGGLLEQVDSTVKETTKSVGTIVESTVKGTTKTVEDTVTFTKDAVETVVDSQQKKPVSSVVTKTVKHVGKTVENVTPVVENTTNTVNTVTGKVEDVVEELPNIPVVKKTVKEVGVVVNETGKSVTKTVNKTVNKTSETVKELPVKETVAKQPTETPVNQPDEKPQSPTTPSQLTTEKPVTPSTPDKEEVGKESSPEQPLFNQRKETEVVEVIEEKTNSNVNEPMPLIDETVVEIVSNTTTETASLMNETKPQNSSTTKNIDEKRKTPATPKHPKPMEYDNPILMATNTITISSPSIAIGSVTDYPMDVDSWQLVNQSLEGRQWIHSSDVMRNQWTNAPPGQPPQQTPFLQVHQN